MKTRILALIALAALLPTSCMKSDLYQGKPDGEEKEFNDFTYSTTRDVTLQVSYLNMGFKASVYFEVYDKMPVDNNGYSYVKKENLAPIFTGNTESDGTFNKKIALPAYAENLYIYTPAFYAQTLIEAKVVNGVVTGTDGNVESTGTRAATTRATNNTTTVIEKYGWKPWLGEFNPANGRITSWDDGAGYAYTGSDPKLTFTSEELAALYTAHTAVINVGQLNCPEGYRSSQDMKIAESAEVTVNLLGGNTCWASSMGYYYYKEGNKPASLEEANVILIFPNTQDGKWMGWGADLFKNNPNYIGVDRGTTVQLKYFPHIQSGELADATTTFPAGLRIGFVLATNTWTGGFRHENTECLAATSENMSIVAGKPVKEPRTAVFRYAKEGLNAVLFSFEDHNNDSNFSDVVFTLKTNPANAIPDLPEPDPDITTPKILQGVYAYEDLWPRKGDFDMNDAIVVSHYQKTYNPDKGISQEAYLLTPYQNIAANINGLGVKLGNFADGEISLSVDGNPIAYSKLDKDVLLITDNIKLYLGKELRVNIGYKTPTKKDNVTIQPFIWKNSTDGKIWEVHIAQEKPTHLADMSFFGTGDDASDVSNNIYYVRKGGYPFGFFLEGATLSDIDKLLIPENESKSIDNVYDGYNDWVTSKGVHSKNWYKK